MSCSYVFKLVGVNQPLQHITSLPNTPGLLIRNAAHLTNAIYTRSLAYDTDQNLLIRDVVFTIHTQQLSDFTTSITVVRSDDLQDLVKHCTFYVLHFLAVDYTLTLRYTEGDNLSIEP